MFNKKAFSLIELSIVLIIIGLLLLGVISGSSLIESARIRNLITELNKYKEQIFIFYIDKERLPGDLNMDLKIGEGSSENYSASSFQFPYDGSDETNNHYIPNYLSAPFVDLYLNETNIFEPKGPSNINALTMSKTGGIPHLNSFPVFFVIFETLTDSKNGVANGLVGKIVFTVSSGNISKGIDAKILKKIDMKLDDGFYNKGVVRGYCTKNIAPVTYDVAINNKIICSTFYYFPKLGF